MGSLFSSSKKESQASTVDDNNKSQTATPAEEKPKPASNKRKLKCAGCEKIVENEQELYSYLNQNYCAVCMKAIKDNNRRTVNNIKRQSAAFSNAQVSQALANTSSNQSNTSNTAAKSDNNSSPTPASTSSADSTAQPQSKHEEKQRNAPDQEQQQEQNAQTTETRERSESDKYVEVNL